jgi:PAS domain-containing protein
LVGTPCAVVGLDGCVIDVNLACERATGVERVDLLGRPVSVLIPRAEFPAHTERWVGLTAGRDGRYELPGRLRRLDDALLEYRFVAHLVRDAVGAPAGVVAVAQPRSPAGATTLPASRWPTAAELAVLRLLAGGKTIGQIAVELDLTNRGVDYRLMRLRRKLRVDGSAAGAFMSSAALVARAYVLGVLHPAVWPPDSHETRGVT